MNNKEIEDLIYQYHWRKKELDRISVILFGHYATFPSTNLVAQYGVEATLPKPNINIKSPAELDRMEAREKRLYNRWKDYKEVVSSIEILGDFIKDDHQLIIMDCMMEGMSYRSIADHLSMNRNKVRDLKEDMLCQICQKCHFLHDLNLEKNVV